MVRRLTDSDITYLQDTYWNAGRVEPPDPSNSAFYFSMPFQGAGVVVTPDTALELSTVWRCGEVIAGAISASDWNVRQYQSEKNWKINSFDRVHYLLNTRPNPEMTARSFKSCLSIAKTFWGNAYAEIVKDMAGRPAELWPIAPDRVEVKRDSEGLLYRVKNDDGTEVSLRPDSILHFRGVGISGLVGDNILTRACHTLALSLAAEQFAEAYFQNGAVPGIILEYPNADQMDDVTYSRFKESWERRHRGPSRAFRFGVVDGGVKIHQLTIDAAKAQMTESRSHQIKEICRWFGVPPHMVGHLEDATLNNIEHLGIEFSRSTLRPLAREYQEECDYKLFSQRGPTRKVIIDLEWASQGDFKSRMEGYQIGRGMGVYSANDIRDKEGEDSIGDDGDIRIVNGAAIRLEDVGKNMVDQSTPTTTDVPNSDPAQAAVRGWMCEILVRAKRRYDNRLAASAKNAERHKTQCEVDAMTYLFSEVSGALEMFNRVFGAVAEVRARAVLRTIFDDVPAESVFLNLVLLTTKE